MFDVPKCRWWSQLLESLIDDASSGFGRRIVGGIYCLPTTPSGPRKYPQPCVGRLIAPLADRKFERVPLDKELWQLAGMIPFASNGTLFYCNSNGAVGCECEVASTSVMSVVKARGCIEQTIKDLPRVSVGLDFIQKLLSIQLSLVARTMERVHHAGC